MMVYRKRQVGYLATGLILGIGVILVGVILSVGESGERGAMVVALGAFSMLALLFMSLTVTVDSSSVRLSFGVGLIRRRIPLERIVSASAVRNSWWYGLGIRLTPHGWMWNIHGLDAVQLTYSNGKHFRIGTADPESLCSAINDSLNRIQSE